MLFVFPAIQKPTGKEKERAMYGEEADDSILQKNK